jgi:hypothetical protein
MNVGDTITVSFEVDSDDFANSPNYPTRGYPIDEKSFAVTSGALTVPIADPYPSWYAPPYFVLRDNDPAADGFFISSANLDYPYPGVMTNVWGFCDRFEAHADIGYDEFAISSLDILDAVGVYEYDGLTRYYFNIVDCGFEVVGIWFQTLTISLAPVEVPVDVKPGSCPNPLNTIGRGDLPVAIMGTETLDVTTIDPASIRLEGVAPLRSDFEDVGTPFEPYVGKQDCELDCVEWEDGDGWMDLTLKFDKQELRDAVGDAGFRECVVLNLTGNFLEEYGGGPILGEDVAVILNQANGRPSVERGIRARDRIQRPDVSVTNDQQIRK